MSNVTRMLIADVGATGSAWVLLDRTGLRLEYHAVGYHPLLSPDSELTAILSDVHNALGEVQEVRYYGTGIVDHAIAEKVRTQIVSVLKCAGNVEVQSDMLAAVHAVSGKDRSLVCILGTGSNSCICSNGTIERQIPTLGYPHGDEGSGWRIGIACIKMYLTGQMSPELRDAFEERFQLNKSEFLALLNAHDSPSRYLASFATFAAKYQADPEVERMIRAQFESYFLNQILPYQTNLPANALGGVAHSFQNILRQIAHGHDINLNTIRKDPVEGLIKYHSNG